MKADRKAISIQEIWNPHSLLMQHIGSTSEPRRFPNRMVLMCENYNARPRYIKKARESVPVTRPTYQGLRIAHSVETSNAEAHADMYNNITRF